MRRSHIGIFDLGSIALPHQDLCLAGTRQGEARIGSDGAVIGCERAGVEGQRPLAGIDIGVSRGGGRRGQLEAETLYRDAIELGRHSGGPRQKMSDGCAFLWRSELAGHPRNESAWRVMYDYAGEALPRPASGLADLHVILAHAVTGDDAALEARNREIEALAASGRYPSGSYLPALARGFAAFERRDFTATIEALAPLAGRNERIGGSRAQHDLIEFTLLKSYFGAGRLEEAKRLLRARRPGASGVPVAGIAAVR